MPATLVLVHGASSSAVEDWGHQRALFAVQKLREREGVGVPAKQRDVQHQVRHAGGHDRVAAGRSRDCPSSAAVRRSACVSGRPYWRDAIGLKRSAVLAGSFQ